MQSFEAPGDARNAIMMYMMMHAGSLQEDTRTQLMGLATSPSPVDQIVRTGEFLYARADEVGSNGRDLAASLIAYASLNGWHGLAEDGRGGRIVMALRRDNGETAPAGLSWPDPSNDPAPKTEFVRPDSGPEVPVVEEPAPAAPSAPTPPPPTSDEE